MSGDAARGDHFSSVAASYAQFRPTYPTALFEWFASVAPRRGVLWECGAGSGQATTALAEYFDRVIATDLSAEQIARAPAHPRVEWVVAPAEKVPIPDGSVDAVAIAQAMHWFDFDRFFAECRRVARPGAVIAAWTYASPSMAGATGDALLEFMYGDDGIGPYWPPERDYITEEYRTIPFPFERIAAPRLELSQEWSSGQVFGYLRSMSATAQFLKARGMDPVTAFERDLPQIWGDAPTRTITWPLIILAGRIA